MKKENSSEQTRMFICLGIVATAISFISIFTSDFWVIVRWILGVAGLLSFLYIISLGSQLKFNNKSVVGQLEISKKLHNFFYNFSINVFGFFFPAVVIFWLGYNFSEVKPTSLNEVNYIFYWVGGVLTIGLYLWMYSAKLKDNNTSKSEMRKSR